MVAFGVQNEAAEEDVQALERAFETLNIFLQGNEYVAGTDLTIADFSIITSVSSIIVSINIYIKKYHCLVFIQFF